MMIPFNINPILSTSSQGRLNLEKQKSQSVRFLFGPRLLSKGFILRVWHKGRVLEVTSNWKIQYQVNERNIWC